MAIFSLDFIDNLLDPTNSSTPLSKVRNTKDYILDGNLKRISKFEYTTIEITTDYGFLVPQNSETKGFAFATETTEYSSDLNDDKVLFDLKITFDENIDQYHREYIKLQGVFGSIGGLLKIIQLLFIILIGPLNKKMINIELMSEIYDFNTLFGHPQLRSVSEIQENIKNLKLKKQEMENKNNNQNSDDTDSIGNDDKGENNNMNKNRNVDINPISIKNTKSKVFYNNNNNLKGFMSKPTSKLGIHNNNFDSSLNNNNNGNNKEISDFNSIRKNMLMRLHTKTIKNNNDKSTNKRFSLIRSSTKNNNSSNKKNKISSMSLNKKLSTHSNLNPPNKSEIMGNKNVINENDNFPQSNKCINCIKKTNNTNSERYEDINNNNIDTLNNITTTLIPNEIKEVDSDNYDNTINKNKYFLNQLSNKDSDTRKILESNSLETNNEDLNKKYNNSMIGPEVTQPIYKLSSSSFNNIKSLSHANMAKNDNNIGNLITINSNNDVMEKKNEEKADNNMIESKQLLNNISINIKFNSKIEENVIINNDIDKEIVNNKENEMENEITKEQDIICTSSNRAQAEYLDSERMLIPLPEKSKKNNSVLKKLKEINLQHKNSQSMQIEVSNRKKILIIDEDEVEDESGISLVKHTSQISRAVRFSVIPLFSNDSSHRKYNSNLDLNRHSNSNVSAKNFRLSHPPPKDNEKNTMNNPTLTFKDNNSNDDNVIDIYNDKRYNINNKNDNNNRGNNKLKRFVTMLPNDYNLKRSNIINNNINNSNNNISSSKTVSNKISNINNINHLNSNISRKISLKKIDNYFDTKINQIKEVIEEKTKVISRLNYSFCELIMSIYCCSSSLKTKRIRKLDKQYSSALTDIYEYINFNSLIKKMQDINNLKLLLLTPEQFLSFKFISKPQIQIEKKSSEVELQKPTKVMHDNRFLDEEEKIKLLIEYFANCNEIGVESIDYKLLELLDEDIKEAINQFIASNINDFEVQEMDNYSREYQSSDQSDEMDNYN